MAKRFEEKHEDLIGGLIRTGMKKNTAIVLSYLFSNEECTQSEMERATDLRQPEVSVAINDIRAKGWLKKNEVKKEGKGRPYHVYSLGRSLNDVLDYIRGREEEKIDEIKKNMDRINYLVKDLKKKKG